MQQKSDIRQALEQAYMEETGGYLYGTSVTRIRVDNSVLPTSAYLKGYSFVEYEAGADPYALVSPDGRVLKVWRNPPSLTELWDTLEPI